MIIPKHYHRKRRDKDWNPDLSKITTGRKTENCPQRKIDTRITAASCGSFANTFCTSGSGFLP